MIDPKKFPLVITDDGNGNSTVYHHGERVPHITKITYESEAKKKSTATVEQNIRPRGTNK